MKTWLFGMTLLGTLMTGCSDLHTTPANLDDMPGSDHMAPGPGIFSQHSKHASDDGLVVYSGNPLAGGGSPTGAAPNGQAPSTAATPASFKAFQDYQAFQAFQAYQRFQALPKNAPERRRFEAWLKWRRCEKAASQPVTP